MSLNNSEKLEQENKQLRKLLKNAIEDMKTNDLCEVCKYANANEDICKDFDFGCADCTEIKTCKCGNCSYDSNFEWRYSEKTK